MRFLVDTIITNNTTGKSVLKAFQVEAVDELDARIKALDLKSGNESIVVMRAHTISDFSHNSRPAAMKGFAVDVENCEGCAAFQMAEQEMKRLATSAKAWELQAKGYSKVIERL